MSDFNGMTKVNSGFAKKSAYNAICFIERQRNEDFQDKLEDIRLLTPFELWFGDFLPFKQYWAFKWNSTPVPEEIYLRTARYKYWERFSYQYRTAKDILRLVEVSSDNTIFVNPTQADMIKFCEEEVESF